MPNIKGDIKNTDAIGAFLGTGNFNATGAFQVNMASKSTSAGTANIAANISFNAKLSNPIYSDDVDTVQPPAIVLIPQIKF